MKAVLLSFVLLCCLIWGCGSSVEVAYDLPSGDHLSFALPPGWKAEGENSWSGDGSRLNLQLQKEEPRSRLTRTVQEAIAALRAGNVASALAVLHANPKPVWPRRAEDYAEVTEAWAKVEKAQALYLEPGGEPRDKIRVRALTLLGEAERTLGAKAAHSLPRRAGRYLAFRSYRTQIVWDLEGVEPCTAAGKSGVLATVKERGSDHDIDQFLLIEQPDGAMIVLAFLDVEEKPDLVKSVAASLQQLSGPAPAAATVEERTEQPARPLSEETKVGLFVLVCVSLPAAIGAIIGHAGVRFPDRRSWSPAAAGAFFTTGLFSGAGSLLNAFYLLGEMVSGAPSHGSGNPLALIALAVVLVVMIAACLALTAAVAFSAAAGAGFGSRLGRWGAAVGAALGAPAGPLLLVLGLKLISWLS